MVENHHPVAHSLDFPDQVRIEKDCDAALPKAENEIADLDPPERV